MDLAPTIGELTGFTVPDYWEARSLLPMLEHSQWPNGRPREHAYAELGRDHIQSSAEHIIMRRDDDFKTVIYPGTGEGELYALADDPTELVNLWGDSRYANYRQQAIHDILEWSVVGNYRANRRMTPKPQRPMQLNT